MLAVPVSRQHLTAIAHRQLAIVKTLSPAVQARLGWVKAAGGAGFYGLGHPRDTFPGWRATEA